MVKEFDILKLFKPIVTSHGCVSDPDWLIAEILHCKTVITHTLGEAGNSFDLTEFLIG